MDKIVISNIRDIEPKHKCEHDPYEYIKYDVTERGKENQCSVAIYKIPPKKSNYPYHYHLRNEEVFYIISGKGILETPDGDRNISVGDIVICPPTANGAHKIVNSSKEEWLVYLDVDTVNSPEVVFYPKSEKVGIIINGKSSDFYKIESNVDYYEGE